MSYATKTGQTVSLIPCLEGGALTHSTNQNKRSIGMSTHENGRSSEDFPVREVQNELRRLEAERARLVEQRDRLYVTVVEAGDDTGFALARLLKKIKQTEERIEQWSSLLRLKGLMR